MITAVLRASTPETAHDIRNMVSVYEGMASLAQEGDDFARARLPEIEQRLRALVAPNEPPRSR